MEVDLGTEAAPDALDRDLDMHLAQAREQLLARLRIATDDERRILLREPPERRPDFLLVALRLRSDGEAHNRLGEADLRGLDLALGVEQQVAGRRVLELRDGADVAGAESGLRVVVLPLHRQQL